MEGELCQRFRESTLDAVLVVRPKEIREEKEEVVTGGFCVPPPGYYNFRPYWNMAYMDVYSTTSYGRKKHGRPRRVQHYNSKDEKLLWSGESDIMLEKSF
jgi:hypothetical protein